MKFPDGTRQVVGFVFSHWIYIFFWWSGFTVTYLENIYLPKITTLRSIILFFILTIHLKRILLIFINLILSSIIVIIFFLDEYFFPNSRKMTTVGMRTKTMTTDEVWFWDNHFIFNEIDLMFNLWDVLNSRSIFLCS